MKVLRKNHNIIIIMLFFISIVLLFLGMIFQKSKNVQFVSAENVQITSTLQETYQVDSMLVLPVAEIHYNDEVYISQSSYLIFPDEKIYQQENYVLDMLGEYTAIYTVTEGNLFLKAEQSFKVVQKNFYVTSDNSQAMYVEELTRVQNPTKGISISLAKGDTFYYNEEIVVGEKDVPFMKLYPYKTVYSDIPSAYQDNGWYFDSPVNRVVVRITDCYDENIYIDYALDIVSSNEYNGHYSDALHTKASCNGNSFVGIGRFSNPQWPSTFIDGIQRNLFYNKFYGTSVQWGLTEYVNYVSLYYDAETKRVYIGDGDNTPKLVNCLGTDEWNETAFQGFTTNEVKVSIFADDYEKDTHLIEIQSIGTKSTSDLEYQDVQDKVKPKIIIDYPYDSNRKYKVAYGEEVTLFDAFALDMHLQGGVTTRVYYNYFSQKPVSVFVKDGKFTCDKMGEYTIVYTAKDLNGNTAEETITFVSVNASENDNKSILFNYTQIPTMDTGKEYVLNNYSFNSINNEDVTIEIEAIFDGDEDNKIVVPTVSGKFVPTCVGEYEIVYKLTGVTGTYTYSYKVESINASVVSIDTSNQILPKVFIKNASYSLEPVSAYKYDKAQPTEILVTYFVSEDGGEYKEIDYNSYKVSADNTVQFKYTAQGATDVESDVIKVYDVGFGGQLDLSKYFDGNDFEKSLKSYLRLSMDGNLTTAQTNFINVLSIKNFEVSFGTLENTNFKKIDFILTDYYDDAKTVVLSFTNNNDMMYFDVNGGTKTELKTTFSNSGRMSVLFNVENNHFELADGSASIDNPISFTSDKILLTIRISEITNASDINIFTICNQQINTSKRDNVQPYIFVDKHEKGMRDKNSVITIKPAVFGDVLSPTLFSNASISVYKPNNQFATSEEGVLLDGTCDATKEYKLKLAEYGVYKIEYSYIDQAGLDIYDSVVIYVEDDIPPTIELENGYTEETLILKKLNSSEKLSNYTVDDNFGKESLTSYIVVIGPNNTNEIYEVGDKVLLNCKGFWRICYYVYDEIGNNVMRYYQIKVE